MPVVRPAISDPDHDTHYFEAAGVCALPVNFSSRRRDLTAQSEDCLGIDKLLIVANGTSGFKVSYSAPRMFSTSLAAGRHIVAEVAKQ